VDGKRCIDCQTPVTLLGVPSEVTSASCGLRIYLTKDGIGRLRDGRQAASRVSDEKHGIMRSTGTRPGGRRTSPRWQAAAGDAGVMWMTSPSHKTWNGYDAP
jgi:hypothetical protein